MVQDSETRQLAAIVFTDLVGFTALMEADEAHARQVLQSQQRLVQSLLGQYGGRLLKEIGDGQLLMFGSGVNAVRCAVAIQEAEKDFALRIGIHIGDVVIEDEEIYGSGVNIASRIESLAPPGGICLTADVWHQTRNHTDLQATRLGHRELKGISLPIELYKLEPGSQQDAASGGLDAAASSDTGSTTRESNAFNAGGTVRSGSGVRSAPMVIAALALLAAASFVVYSLIPDPVAPPDVNRLSIAVLPFENLSPDQDDAYFAEGIHEDIIIKLSRIGGIRTISRRSVQEFAGSDLERIADELKVGSILEGSVRRSGDRIRVAVQHVDTRSHETLWAQSFVRGEITDLFEIQSAIAEQIVSALEANLSPDEQEQLRQRPTEIAEAHTFYMKGRASLRKEGTLENLKEAAGYFEQALEQDPEYGLAMAGLCTAQWQQYDLTRDNEMAEEAIDTCRQADRHDSLAETHVALANLYLGIGELDQAWSALERALEIEPGNAEAYSVRGQVYEERGELEAAESDLRKAIELDPGYWRHYNDLGVMYFKSGRYELAAEQFSRAIELEPASPRPYSNLGGALVHLGEYLKGADAIRQSIELRPTDRAYSNAGVNYFFAGNYSEAEAMFEEAIAMNPSNFLYHGSLGDVIAIQEGRSSEAKAHYEEAIRLARERLEVNPNDHSTLARIALYLARIGRIDEAREELRNLSELEQLDYDAELSIGMTEFFLGNKTEAIEHFQRAIDLGYPRDLLEADPNLEPLSDHPAYQDLMRDDSS
ncbi:MULTISPECIES: tetratricopeptide repeat protein [unclassified Wenzhouxiangella]|uniref:tetratricopeptide repeat protein n=1 Tax=unclassified Wenzhouxiangella TaxID=2613841 RepID=UPI000E3271AF|nr:MULTISPECIES: tetratricopeptide repeat protein [unclassified Wenzhouxiangella]RFF26988.1 tetratricopeptide repeat protein [Wenzhouxiangella sp. 15181]RFP69500.1 tetratricopeptide repeat protein [Wenzhouxiangella sp. 15190]